MIAVNNTNSSLTAVAIPLDLREYDGSARAFIFEGEAQVMQRLYPWVLSESINRPFFKQRFEYLDELRDTLAARIGQPIGCRRDHVSLSQCAKAMTNTLRNSSARWVASRILEIISRKWDMRSSSSDELAG
jgi:hypothetical protein